ncbi:hypothetical protein BMR11_17370, partial [Methylococcaceae bacterium CS5]
CVGERITATGVPEFREVAWRAYLFTGAHQSIIQSMLCISLSEMEISSIAIRFTIAVYGLYVPSKVWF